MAKPKKRYVCQACGSVQSRWQGQCPDCSEWNSMVEDAGGDGGAVAGGAVHPDRLVGGDLPDPGAELVEGLETSGDAPGELRELARRVDDLRFAERGGEAS